MSHRVRRKIDCVVMGRSSGLIEAGTHVEFGTVRRGERHIYSHAARMQCRPIAGIGGVARVGVDRPKEFLRLKRTECVEQLQAQPNFDSPESRRSQTDDVPQAAASQPAWCKSADPPSCEPSRIAGR